jgi:hypothetical protein
MDDLTNTNQVGMNYPNSAKDAPSREHSQIQRNTNGPIDFSLRSLSQDEFKKFDPSDLEFLRANLPSSTKVKVSSKRSLFSNRFIKTTFRRIRRTQSVEVIRVWNVCQHDLKSFQWGWVNPPIEGDEFIGSNIKITIGGWLIGRNSQPRIVRLLFDQTVIAEAPINVPRPDVAKTHSFQHPNCGYSISLDTTLLPDEAEVILDAVFPDMNTAIVGSILIRKYG